MPRDELNRLPWELDFDTASIQFSPTMLEMEFENKVEIKRFYYRYQSSPDFRYMPKGEYSNKIKIEFIKKQIHPPDTNLVFIFLAESRPVFTKVVWTNKSMGVKPHDLDKKEITRLNQFP